MSTPLLRFSRKIPKHHFSRTGIVEVRRLINDVHCTKSTKKEGEAGGDRVIIPKVDGYR